MPFKMRASFVLLFCHLLHWEVPLHGHEATVSALGITPSLTPFKGSSRKHEGVPKRLSIYVAFLTFLGGSSWKSLLTNFFFYLTGQNEVSWLLLKQSLGKGESFHDDWLVKFIDRENSKV